jgi:hypothetical protein
MNTKSELSLPGISWFVSQKKVRCQHVLHRRRGKRKQIHSNHRDSKYHRDQSGTVITKIERQKEIQNLEEKLRVNREKLKSAKAANVKENKIKSLKRKIETEVKKQKGNELTQGIPAVRRGRQKVIKIKQETKD